MPEYSFPDDEEDCNISDEVAEDTFNEKVESGRAFNDQNILEHYLNPNNGTDTAS